MIWSLTVQAVSIWPQPYYSLQLLIYSGTLLMECGGGDSVPPPLFLRVNQFISCKDNSVFYQVRQ